MSKKIDCISKRPGELPRHVSISNNLKNLQKHVEGYIEVVPMGDGVVMICNEEGKLMGLPINFAYGLDLIVGNVIFCGANEEGEFTNIPIDFKTFKKKFPFTFDL